MRRPAGAADRVVRRSELVESAHPGAAAASKLVFAHDPRVLNSTGLFLLRHVLEPRGQGHSDAREGFINAVLKYLARAGTAVP